MNTNGNRKADTSQEPEEDDRKPGSIQLAVPDDDASLLAAVVPRPDATLDFSTAAALAAGSSLALHGGNQLLSFDAVVPHYPVIYNTTTTTTTTATTTSSSQQEPTNTHTLLTKPPPPPSTSSRSPHILTDEHGNQKKFGSALGLLACKFIAMVKSSESGIVDMGVCAAQLGVPKRRIYDITNVLEGVGYLEKRSKNCVAYKGSEAILGSTIDPDAKARIDHYRAENSALAKEESQLDQWLTWLHRNNQGVVSQSVRTDEIVQAIFYPVNAPVESLPTKQSLLDETGKPKCVLIAVQAPLGSYAHIVPSTNNDDDHNNAPPERQLYVGNAAGLAARYNISTPPPPGAKRQSPYTMTTGRVFKSARRDERNLAVYVLPTYFDERDQKLRTTGLRLLASSYNDGNNNISHEDPYALAAAAAAQGILESDSDGPKQGVGDDIEGADHDVDDEGKRERSSSWDVAESMANDEGVSEFFDDENDVV